MPTFQFLGGDHGRGLLESALAQPQQAFGGRYLYRTIFDKGATLFQSLDRNHPFLDGNKRLALTALNVFLTLNSYLFYAPRDEAVNFTLRLASSARVLPQVEVSRWIKRNSINSDKLLFQLETQNIREISKTAGITIPAIRNFMRLVQIMRETTNISQTMVEKP